MHKYTAAQISKCDCRQRMVTASETDISVCQLPKIIQKGVS